jgi:hypothetical protein
MFPGQGSWNWVIPLKSTSVFFEAVLFEVVPFGTDAGLAVPVTADFVADLADFGALLASILPPRLQDTNTSSARKMKNHLPITEECIISPPSQ